MRLHVDQQMVTAQRGLGGVRIERRLGRDPVVLVAVLGVQGEEPGRGTEPARRVQRRRALQRRGPGVDLFGDTGTDPQVACAKRYR